MSEVRIDLFSGSTCQQTKTNGIRVIIRCSFAICSQAQKEQYQYYFYSFHHEDCKTDTSIFFAKIMQTESRIK